MPAKIMNSSDPAPVRWEKLGQEALASTRIFELRRVHYRHPGRRRERDFVVIDSPDWVNVLALTPDARLVLVRQFRFGIDDFSLEIPGGVLERGEDPLAGGLRELREETGYAGKNARIIGRVHPNPAVQNNTCHLVLVEDAVPVAAPEWDHDEEIAVSVLPVEDVFVLARGGGITHALVLDALLLFAPLWAAASRGRGAV